MMFFFCKKKTLNGDVATILLSGCRGYIDKIWENSNLSKVLKNGLSCDPGLVFANHLGIFLIMSDRRVVKKSFDVSFNIVGLAQKL